MSRSLKSENPVAAGFTQNEKTNKKHLNFLLILPTEQPLEPPPLEPPGGWRGALASGVGKFRKYGAYDHAPSGRAARRALARFTKSERGAK